MLSSRTWLPRKDFKRRVQPTAMHAPTTVATKKMEAKAQCRSVCLKNVLTTRSFARFARRFAHLGQGTRSGDRYFFGDDSAMSRSDGETTVVLDAGVIRGVSAACSRSCSNGLYENDREISGAGSRIIWGRLRLGAGWDDSDAIGAWIRRVN